MLDSQKENTYSRDAIMKDVTRIIEDMLSDWDMQSEEQIRSETHLGADLAFKSIDLVRLISEIQQKYVHKLIPFEKLFLSDKGEMLQDIQISYLADFLFKHLNNI